MSRPTGKALEPSFVAAMAVLKDQVVTLNQAHGLSGALIVNPKFFIQVLEGDARPLFSTLARITRDPRHDELRIFDISGVSQRIFGNWEMHFGAAEDVSPALIWSCVEAFRHPGPLGAGLLISALQQSVRSATG